MSLRRISRYFAATVLVMAAVVSAASAQTYVQTNLVSDIPGLAPTTDTHLVNPWGIARLPVTANSQGSPWWVADNGTGVSTIYTGAGVPAQNPPGTQFVVKIPTPTGTGTSAPTGMVSVPQPSPPAPPVFAGAHFIFATEDGTIAAWISGFSAVIEVDHSSTAIYKGLAISSFMGANYLYAADFHTGVVEVYDSNFQPHVFSTTAFTDPSIPDGFAPFNVQAIGSAIVVTFAKQDKDKSDEVDRNGLGFVDVFSTNGVLMMPLQTGPWLNAPWGVAMAPATGFGQLSGFLLVGNFGSGLIAAYNPVSGDFVSFLMQSPGAPMKISGLWSIAFGNGGNAGPTNTLFFSAGIASEHHGLFGMITPK